MWAAEAEPSTEQEVVGKAAQVSWCWEPERNSVAFQRHLPAAAAVVPVLTRKLAEVVTGGSVA